MRYIKKTAVLFLILAVVFGLAACTNKLTGKDFISEFEAYGLKESDKFDLLRTNMDGHGIDHLYFVAKDHDEAKRLINIALNPLKAMPEIEANEFVLGVDTVKGSDDDYYNSFVCFMTFENDKQAEKTYQNFVETYGDEEYGKTGTESNITYCIDSGVSAAGSNKIGTGVYLQGNVLVFMRAKSAVNDNYVFADTICSKFGLISPSTAE